MTEFLDQVSVIRTAKYDGTNAAQIVAEFGAIVISETGGVLTYADTGSGPFYTANLNDYIHWSGPGSSSTFAVSAPLAFPYVVLPLKALFTVTGSTAVPASTLGGAQNLTVNLSGSLAAGYVPLVFLRGAPNILGGHAVTGVNVVDGDTVTVHIQSNPLSLSGGSVFVVAQEVRTL